MYTIATETTKIVEIGIVKWFNQSEQDLDYRILTLEDERRWKLHHQEIKCSEYELKRGRFIRFEIQDNKIKNLNLLREVGIIDWYQKDKGFGCALLQRDDLLTFFEKQTKGKAEVFVHINQISCSNEELKEGVAVVFDIKKDLKNNQLRDNATNLTLLTQETNPEIIEACALSQDVKLWYPVFKLYLNSFNADQLKVYFCLQKLNTLTKSSTGIRGCTLSQRSFADEIPDNILIASQELINYISLQKLIGLVKNNENYNSDILWDELIKRLQNLPETDLHWKTIPEDIVSNERIWSLLPNQNRIKILVSKLSNSSNPEKLISEIGGILNNSSQTDHSELLCLIPENLKKYPTIFELLSDSEKVKLLFLSLEPLISSLSEQQQKNIVNDIRPKISSEFIKFLSFLKAAKKSISLDIPPVKISAEEYLQIFMDTEAVKRLLDASDADQIREFVRERKIERIVHLTRLQNLKNICEHEGILSLENLHKYQIETEPFDGEKPEGIQYKNYVNCSLTYYNFHMLYPLVHISGETVIIFHIKPDYLWKEGTKFCQFNAATDVGRHIGQGFRKLQSLFAESVIDRKGIQDRDGKPDNLPTCIQAEVLIPNGIPLEDITEIIVRSSSDETKVRDAGWQGKIKMNRSLFNYCSDWYCKEV
jgi:cold shock CspA family protein